MQLDVLLSKLGFFILAGLSSKTHNSRNQHAAKPQKDISTSDLASTTSPPSPWLTPTPFPPDLAARADGFTNPLLPTHPTLFYITATALHVISGVTVSTIYTDLVSGTAVIPLTDSTELDLSAPATATTSSSAIDTSLVFPIEPSVPPGSPTPTLDLGACSTATGNGVKACEDSLIGSFNSAFGGKTTSSSESVSVVSVSPTRTVTAAYLGAEVAKGEATWALGTQANGGSRGIGFIKWNVRPLFAGFGVLIAIEVFR